MCIKNNVIIATQKEKPKKQREVAPPFHPPGKAIRDESTLLSLGYLGLSVQSMIVFCNFIPNFQYKDERHLRPQRTSYGW